MSLTQLIKYIKKFGPLALLGIIIFFILFYSIRVALILNQNRQGENIVLNPVFGKLPRPKILSSTTSAGLKFQIDTIEGKPVTATKSANVYSLLPTSTKFGYRDRISKMAKQLGFADTNTYSLVGDTTTFKNDSQSLDIKISNFNFKYLYQYEKDADLFIRSIIPTAQESVNNSISLLQSLDRFPSEFDSANTTSSYFYFNSEKKITVPVARNIDANIVEVNFYRKNLDDIPTVSTRFPNSNNYVKLASSSKEFVPIEVQINFFERSLDNVGAYPLISGDVAYELLKKGKGVVLLNSNPDNKNIIIKKMYVAYFEPEIYMKYLQPFYVFEGDGFATIIYAISPGYKAE